LVLVDKNLTPLLFLYTVTQTNIIINLNLAKTLVRKVIFSRSLGMFLIEYKDVIDT